VSCQDTASHHRVITYNFGELKITFRHAADVMYGDDYLEDTPPPMSIQGAAIMKTYHRNLAVKPGGHLVPIKDILELVLKCGRYFEDLHDTQLYN
jgi:hypothetical protein